MRICAAGQCIDQCQRTRIARALSNVWMGHAQSLMSAPTTETASAIVSALDRAWRLDAKPPARWRTALRALTCILEPAAAKRTTAGMTNLASKAGRASMRLCRSLPENADCAGAQSCVDGECVEPAVCRGAGDCNPGRVCVDEACQDHCETTPCAVRSLRRNGPMRGGSPCAGNDGCFDGRVCEGDICSDPCLEPARCPGGMRCIEGACEGCHLPWPI